MTKRSNSKRVAAPSKKQPVRRNRVEKSKSTKQRPTIKPAQKKTSARAKHKKKASVSIEREVEQEIRSKNLTASGMVSSWQSGDLQGLSRRQQADSESVDELVEEGNLFEAGAVAGVEEADDADEREVHTHEMPEDDVPEEYLDEK